MPPDPAHQPVEGMKERQLKGAYGRTTQQLRRLIEWDDNQAWLADTPENTASAIHDILTEARAALANPQENPDGWSPANALRNELKDRTAALRRAHLAMGTVAVWLRETDTARESLAAKLDAVIERDYRPSASEILDQAQENPDAR